MLLARGGIFPNKYPHIPGKRIIQDKGNPYCEYNQPIYDGTLERTSSFPFLRVDRIRADLFRDRRHGRAFWQEQPEVAQRGW